MVRFQGSSSPSDLPPSLDPAYQQLLKIYLSFFLPRKGTGEDIVDESRTTPRKSVAPPEGRRRSIPQATDIFHSIPYPKSSSTSSFFVQCIIESWLCQNDPKADLSLHPYVKPNPCQLESILILLKHLNSLNLSKIVADYQTGSLRLDSNRVSGEFYDIAKANAYRSLRPKLYTFLKLGFENWPRNDDFYEIVDVWITYITPWTDFGGRYNEEWAPFVHDNFLFYTRLFYIFLMRTKTFDLYASSRAYKQNTHIVNNLGIKTERKEHNRKYLDILEKVISVFKDKNLIQLLKVLEMALCSLDTFAGTPQIPKSPMTPGFSSSPRLKTLGETGSPRSRQMGDPMYVYQNSGPKTRGDVIFLEGTYNYLPLFQNDVQQKFERSVDLVNQLIFSVSHCIDRLNYLLQKDVNESKSPIGTPRLRAKPPQSEGFVASVMAGIKSFLPEHTTHVALDKDQMLTIETNVKRLDLVLSILSQIWGLDVDSIKEQTIGMRRSASDLALLDGGEEAYMETVAPGVYAPEHLDKSNRLTRRGREQVKFINLDQKRFAQM